MFHKSLAVVVVALLGMSRAIRNEQSLEEANQEEMYRCLIKPDPMQSGPAEDVATECVEATTSKSIQSLG